MSCSTISTINKYMLSSSKVGISPLAFYNVISTSNLILAYSFEPHTISGTSVGNLASGSVVYDATVTSSSAIISTNPKFGTGSLSNASIMTINKTFTLSTNGITISYWNRATSMNSTNGAGLFAFTSGTSTSPTNHTIFLENPSNNNYTIQYYDTSTWRLPYSKAGNASIADSAYHHYVMTITYGSV